MIAWETTPEPSEPTPPDDDGGTGDGPTDPE